MTDPTSFRFSREQRLRSAAQFELMRQRGAVRHAGPLRVAALPNTLGFNRMGLAISKRCGSSVERNRVKRQLREAFRLLRHELPRGYDLVIAARTHDPVKNAQYRQWLTDAIQRLDRHWKEHGPS